MCLNTNPIVDMHVVTESGEQCFMWHSNQLTYISQNRHELPQVLATKFGPTATKLDLSYNSLTSFRNINLFTRLNELILDNNNLEDDQLDFRQNLRLKTLSLNKNKLADINKLICSIRLCFPNLEFLSLIGNPLYPSPLSSGSYEHLQKSTNCIRVAPQMDNSIVKLSGHSKVDLDEYEATEALDYYNLRDSESAHQKYRYFIINHLPNLRFLDSSFVSSQERDESLMRCYWIDAPVATTDDHLNCEQQQRQVQSISRQSSGWGQDLEFSSGNSSSSSSGSCSSSSNVSSDWKGKMDNNDSL